MSTTGTVIQVIGSTFDAQFPLESLPAIYNAVQVEIDNAGEKIKLVGEQLQTLACFNIFCL